MSAVSQSVEFTQLADRPASGRYLKTAGGLKTFSQMTFYQVFPSDDSTFQQVFQVTYISPGTSPAQETLTLANFCKRTLNVQGTWSLPTSEKIWNKICSLGHQVRGPGRTWDGSMCRLRPSNSVQDIQSTNHTLSLQLSQVGRLFS